MEFYAMDRLPQVRVLGRSPISKGAVTLFWSASGLEFLFDGSLLSISFEADYAQMPPWVSFEMDGAWIARFPLARGCSEVCLLRGTAPGNVHRIRILKETQAMSDDPTHLLQILGLTVEGSILPPPSKRYRIEFVGDSLASGEGAIGAPCDLDWISPFFSAASAYLRLTADALNADFRVISQSGWGILSSWDNDPRHALPDYYERTCGVASGLLNYLLGAQNLYAFSSWPADAVVINLGTNDDSAFRFPGWTHPVTGRLFESTYDADGRYAATAVKRLQTAVLFCLRKLRMCNPQAKLVWAFGMLPCPQMAQLLQDAIAQYRQDSSDQNVWFLPLPANTAATMGSRAHPGLSCHRAAADTLTNFLLDILPAASAPADEEQSKCNT